MHVAVARLVDVEECGGADRASKRGFGDLTDRWWSVQSPGNRRQF